MTENNDHPIQHSLQPLVSFLIPAYGCSSFIERTTISIQNFLERHTNNSYEILIIPNGEKNHAETIATYKASKALENLPTIRVIELSSSSVCGKGAALRQGVEASCGKYIYFTDADHPYNLSFFDAAYPLLTSGISMVVGNRRLKNSRFTVTTDNFRLSARRHILSLMFNFYIRTFFPITVTDTQAGIKAMTLDFAKKAFHKTLCDGFFFDIELFLIAHSNKHLIKELPVEFNIHKEKSTVYLFHETIKAFYTTIKIFKNYHKKYYEF